MSAIETFTRPSASRENRVAGLIGSLNQRVQRYRTYRKTLEELETLSDRELFDLGLSRAQFRAIAYNAAYGG